MVRIKDRRLDHVVAISAGTYHNVAVNAGGELLTWGRYNSAPATVPPGLSNIVAVSAGWVHTLALRRDGTLAWWGEEGYVPAPPEGLSNLVAVAAARGGGGLDMALRRDGTVVAWPLLGLRDRPTVPPDLSKVVAIASRWCHCLALRADSKVVGWYGGEAGEATGVPKRRDHYKEEPYRSGYISGAAPVTIDGKVLDSLTAIAAGNQFSMALRRDGTVVTWGRPPVSPPLGAPAGLSGVTGIAAGDCFCLAITTNTAAWLADGQPVRPR